MWATAEGVTVLNGVRFRRLCQVSAKVAFKFNLDGLKWSRGGVPICSDCGRDCDGENDAPEAEPPILFWKDGGQLMLALCSRCATKRLLA